MFCPACGLKNSVEASQCGRCGASLPVSHAAPPTGGSTVVEPQGQREPELAASRSYSHGPDAFNTPAPSASYKRPRRSKAAPIHEPLLDTYSSGEWSMGDENERWDHEPSGPSILSDRRDYAGQESPRERRGRPADRRGAPQGYDSYPSYGGGGPNGSRYAAPKQAQRPRVDNSTHFAGDPYVPPMIGSSRSPHLGVSHLRPGEVKLVVEQGMILGERFLLGDVEILIGRLDSNSGLCPDIDLSAQDPAFVHRRHARLRFDLAEQALYMEDLGGRNGSFVNNRPLTPRNELRLRIGDKLRVGRVVMRLLDAPEMLGE